MMLNSTDWAQKFIFLAQIEIFKSRDLTEQEKIVKQWMEEKIEFLREKENEQA
jgi:hypothetical protein